MSNKKQIRSQFRTQVFTRDGYRCVCCGKHGKCRQTNEFIGIDVPRVNLDAHHITDRNLMPNGGYVKENGISVCDDCHELCEVFHQTGEAHPGYAPADLYKMVGSSYEAAVKASEKL